MYGCNYLRMFTVVQSMCVPRRTCVHIYRTGWVFQCVYFDSIYRTLRFFLWPECIETALHDVSIVRKHRCQKKQNVALLVKDSLTCVPTEVDCFFFSFLQFQSPFSWHLGECPNPFAINRRREARY